MLQISFLETSKNQFQTHPPQKQSLHPLFNLTLLSLVLSVFRPFSSRIKNSLALPPALYRPIGSKSLLSSSKSRLESLALCLFTATIRDVSRVRFPSKGLVFTRPRGEAFTLMNGRQWRRLKGHAWKVISSTLRARDNDERTDLCPKKLCPPQRRCFINSTRESSVDKHLSKRCRSGSDNVTKDFLLLLFFFSFSRASKS